MSQLVAEQDGDDVVVRMVPARWVPYLRDFLNMNHVSHTVGPESVDVATGTRLQPHAFRFANARENQIQRLMDDFLETHYGQMLRADLDG